MAALNQSRQEAIEEWTGIVHGYRTGSLKPPFWMTKDQAIADALATLELVRKL